MDHFRVLEYSWKPNIGDFQLLAQCTWRPHVYTIYNIPIYQYTTCMRKVEGIAVVVARRGDLSVHPSNHPSGAAPQRNSFQINAIQLHFPSCLAKFKCLRTESEATKKSTIGHLSTNVKLFFFFLFLVSSSLLIHLIKYPKG